MCSYAQTSFANLLGGVYRVTGVAVVSDLDEQSERVGVRP